MRKHASGKWVWRNVRQKVSNDLLQELANCKPDTHDLKTRALRAKVCWYDASGVLSDICTKRGIERCC